MQALKLLLFIFGLPIMGCSQDAPIEHEAKELAHQSSLLGALNPPRNTYTGTLHLCYGVASGEVNASAGGDTLKMETHREFAAPDKASAYLISQTEYIVLSTAGRSRDIIECDVEMGLELPFDGATSSKVNAFKTRHPEGLWVLVAENGVVYGPETVASLSAYSIGVNTRNTRQTEVIRNAFVKNTGR